MGRKLVFLAWAAPFALLAGCMVGPDFQPPNMPMPADWAAPAVAPTTAPTTRGSSPASQAIAITQWWQTFHDAQLNSLMQRALDSNLTLAQATSRIRQARAQRGVTAAALWPTLNANASYTRTGTPADASPTGHPFSSDFYHAGFDAAWELDIFGGTRRNIESADANIQAAVEDRHNVLITLTGEVAADYINLRSFQQQIIIAQQNLDAQKSTADVTRKQFNTGFIGHLNSANADAQVASTRSQIPTLQAAAQQSIYALSLLLGQDPPALQKELEASAPIPPTPPLVPIGLPSDLLRRRPDVRQAEAQLHAATAQIGVATAQLFPQFSLTGAFGPEGSTPKSLLSLVNSAWSVGPSVNWPIFNAGQIASNIEVQNALQEQALLNYRATVLQSLDDVYAALIAYAKEQERRTSLEQAVESNKDAVRLARQLYLVGQTDFLNVLTAQQALLTSQSALVQSQAAVSTDLVALYKALGGGWETFDESAAATQPHSAVAPNKQ